LDKMPNVDVCVFVQEEEPVYGTKFVKVQTMGRKQPVSVRQGVLATTSGPPIMAKEVPRGDNWWIWGGNIEELRLTPGKAIGISVMFNVPWPMRCRAKAGGT